MSDEEHNIEPLTDAPEETGERLEELDRDWLADVDQALRSEDDAATLALIQGHTPVDLSNLLINLPLRRARLLYSLLPVDAAAAVLAEISEELRASLVQDASIERIANVADDSGGKEAALEETREV